MSMRVEYFAQGDTLGNVFGYPKTVGTPGFAVVEDDEYCTGGNGPIQASAKMFNSEELAIEELRRLS